MEFTLLLSLTVALTASAVAQAQAPAQPAPKPAAAAPAAPAPRSTQPARRAAQPAAGRAGMAMTVTGLQGATIPGVQVQITGPTERSGQTDSGGQVNFPGLQAGTYRVRFSGEMVTAFEREVTLRAGQIADLDITLSPAPPPREVKVPVAAPPPEPPAPAVGPAGQAQVLSVIDLAERELINAKQPRRDTLVACSGNTRTMLVQLNEPQARRVYDGAESVYYVVAGEGSVTLPAGDVTLAAGAFVSVPRGTGHAITRRGRRPLIMLAILSGEPCEQPK